MTSDQAQPSERLLSLDTFRGLIMCTLAVNGFALAATAKQLGYTPDAEVDSAAGWIWQTLAFHNSHPFWNSQFYVVGCSYWDLIQPAFMFMVGVAMPYSFASRRQPWPFATQTIIPRADSRNRARADWRLSADPAKLV